jgi:hypothetical protein
MSHSINDIVIESKYPFFIKETPVNPQSFSNYTFPTGASFGTYLTVYFYD